MQAPVPLAGIFCQPHLNLVQLNLSLYFFARFQTGEVDVMLTPDFKNKVQFLNANEVRRRLQNDSSIAGVVPRWIMNGRLSKRSLPSDARSPFGESDSWTGFHCTLTLNWAGNKIWTWLTQTFPDDILLFLKQV